MARSENLRQGTELALVISTALPGLRCAIAEGRCDLMPSTPGQASCFVVEGLIMQNHHPAPLVGDKNLKLLQQSSA